MKTPNKLKGLKSLSRNEQKKIEGGLIPKDTDCGWNMCLNQFGRCTAFTDHCV